MKKIITGVLLWLLALSAAAIAQQGGPGVGPYGFAPIGQLPGTATNDNAAAGKIGEIITGSGTVALTSGVITDLGSVSLSAGDWDCSATVSSNFSVGITRYEAWLSLTSAARPAVGSSSCYASWEGSSTTINIAIPTGLCRFSVASTTTVYVSTDQIFASGTDSGTYQARCRRVR